MIAAVSADDGILFQQLSNPVPVIQKFVVHGIPPVPRTERIAGTVDVFRNAFCVGVERGRFGIGIGHAFQEWQERGVLAQFT